jgi:hypothetical protein
MASVSDAIPPLLLTPLGGLEGLRSSRNSQVQRWHGFTISAYPTSLCIDPTSLCIDPTSLCMADTFAGGGVIPERQPALIIDPPARFFERGRKGARRRWATGDLPPHGWLLKRPQRDRIRHGVAGCHPHDGAF